MSKSKQAGIIYICTHQSSLGSVKSFINNQQIWRGSDCKVSVFFFSHMAFQSDDCSFDEDIDITFSSLPHKITAEKDRRLRLFAHVLKEVDSVISPTFSGNIFIRFVDVSDVSSLVLDCSLPAGYLYIKDSYYIDYAYRFDDVIIDRSLLPMLKGLYDFEYNTRDMVSNIIVKILVGYRGLIYELRHAFLISCNLLVKIFISFGFTIISKILKRVTSYLENPLRTNELYSLNRACVDSEHLPTSQSDMVFRTFVIKNGLRANVRFLSDTDFFYCDDFDGGKS